MVTWYRKRRSLSNPRLWVRPTLWHEPKIAKNLNWERNRQKVICHVTQFVFIWCHIYCCGIDHVITFSIKRDHTVKQGINPARLVCRKCKTYKYASSVRFSHFKNISSSIAPPSFYHLPIRKDSKFLFEFHNLFQSGIDDKKSCDCALVSRI